MAGPKVPRVVGPKIVPTPPEEFGFEPVSDDTLGQWWTGLAGEEAEGARVKAEEYGSFDLDLIGYVLGQMAEAGSEQRVSSVELGLAFYLLGKVARMFGAYVAGAEPSDDTLTDISVYTKMIQRYRARGTWP